MQSVHQISGPSAGTHVFLVRRRHQDNFWVSTLGLGTETWSGCVCPAPLWMTPRSALVLDMACVDGVPRARHAATGAFVPADELLAVCCALACDPDAVHCSLPPDAPVSYPDGPASTGVVVVTWFV
jgi:hypothetical protein